MAEKQLIVVVEGTAAMGAFWETILSDYLDKIIRCLCWSEATGQKHFGTNVELSLVVFNAHGPYSACAVQRSRRTRDMDVFFQWLAAITFSGGGFSEVEIAEGLTEALMMFSTTSNGNQDQPSVDGQKHCILVAATNPYSLPTPVPWQTVQQMEQDDNADAQSESRPSDAETVAKSFSQHCVSLSLISPKQLPKLKAIYSAGKRNPRAVDLAVDNDKNPHFLILISENFMEAHAALSRPEVTNLAANQTPLKLDTTSVPPILGPAQTSIPSVIMATQRDGIGSSVDPSGKKKYGKSIRWTPDLSHHFMEYVAEEVKKGYKKNNTLDKEGWVHVKERFLNESSVTVSIDQLRNHFDRTRRLWQGWQYLATQTKLGWDQVNKTYTAPDSFWEGFKKMYKDGFQLRWKGLSYEEEQYLQTIYGGSGATAEDRRNPSSDTIPPNVDERDLDHVGPLGNDDESTPNVEINNPPTTEQMHTATQPQLGTCSRASTPSLWSQPPTRRRRRSETSSTESSMSRACDIMEERTKLMEQALAPKSIEQAQLSSFEKSMQLLEALPSFNPLNPMYAWAPSFLCNKVKRLMFISISNTQLREVWLKAEFEKSTGSGGSAI